MAEEQLPIPTEQQVFEFARAPEPEPVAETPVEETPIAEPPKEPVAPETSTPPPVAEPEVQVPSWRLREEAEARRAAETRAQALEARINEITTHLRQQPPPKKADFFDAPEQATQSMLQQYIAPYIEENRRTLMQLGKMVAGTVHGVDKVTEAEEAFLKARTDQTLDVMDYERVVQAPNRYDAVVQWHKRQSVLSSVGDDPTAWFEKQLEAKLADPKFQASLLEKVKASTGTAAKSGTGKTAIELPPSLSKAAGMAGNGRDEPAGDLSDASLFAHATRR